MCGCGEVGEYYTKGEVDTIIKDTTHVAAKAAARIFEGVFCSVAQLEQEKLDASKFVSCIYCGEKIPIGAGLDAIKDHMIHCPKHPAYMFRERCGFLGEKLEKAEHEISVLKRRLTQALVGKEEAEKKPTDGQEKPVSEEAPKKSAKKASKKAQKREWEKVSPNSAEKAE